MGSFIIFLTAAVSCALAQQETTTPTRYVFDMGKNVPALDAEAVIDLMASASPGVSFPLNDKVPNTGFNCAQQGTPGYFADPAPPSLCQAFYRCDVQGNQTGFLCPNQTLFNQLTLTCDYYFNVDCVGARSLYNFANSRLYQPGRPLFDTPPKGYISLLNSGGDYPTYPSNVPAGRDANGGTAPVVPVIQPPPTAAPTDAPTTAAPTAAPTEAPTTAAPTATPTDAPTTPAPTTAAPTAANVTDNSTAVPVVVAGTSPAAPVVADTTTTSPANITVPPLSLVALPVSNTGLQGSASALRVALQSGGPQTPLVSGHGVNANQGPISPVPTA